MSDNPSPLCIFPSPTSEVAPKAGHRGATPFRDLLELGWGEVLKLGQILGVEDASAEYRAAALARLRSHGKRDFQRLHGCLIRLQHRCLKAAPGIGLMPSQVG